VGTLIDVIALVYDVDLTRLSNADIVPDATLAAVEASIADGDAQKAIGLLDSELDRLRVFQRLVTSEAASLQRKDPERGLDMPLYMSDLHCRRARLRLRGGNLEAARTDLVAAALQPSVHPNARPLLVEVYEAMGRIDLALTLLARIHADDRLSLAIGILRLLVGARESGCDERVVALGVDLLRGADQWKLFAGIATEHATWTAPPPNRLTLDALHQEALAALNEEDFGAARHALERLVAWTFTAPEVWFTLGDLWRRESDRDRAATVSAVGAPLPVVELPDDATALRAAAEAFHLACYFGPKVKDFWIALSAARLSLGETAAADEAIGYALAIDPRDPEAHWIRGVALHREGRLEEFLTEALTVLDLDPTHEYAKEIVSQIDAALAETRAQS
jgi:tetratricopeptide (TPR) repeat protein